MGEVLETILASPTCRRFLAEHPAGWTTGDWQDFAGRLAVLGCVFDEDELKRRVLDLHLARRGDRGAVPAGPLPASTPTPARGGLPLHLRVGLVLVALLALACLVVEFAG
jgi:hypothetical protein